MSPPFANRFGLSRKIPEAIARKIRKDAGFGCVVCGDAIYQFEHIDPEFSNARKHDPAKMTILCGGCHFKVTKGLWSKEKIKSARDDPYCKSHPWSKFDLDLKRKFVVELGSGFFVNPITMLKVNERKVLAIEPPNSPDSPPLISAIFCDRNGKEVASIVRNEWRGSESAFDIDCKGTRFKIRSEIAQVDLAITFEPQVGMRIDAIEMLYRGTRIKGRQGSAFSVSTRKGSIQFPSDAFTVEGFGFCVATKDDGISMALDPSFRLWGRQSVPPMAIWVLGGDVSFLNFDEAESSGNLEPGMKPGDRIIKAKNSFPCDSKVGVAFVFPHPSGLGKKLVMPVWTEQMPNGESFCMSVPSIEFLR